MSELTPVQVAASKEFFASLLERRIGQQFDNECTLDASEARLIAGLLRQAALHPAKALNEVDALTACQKELDEAVRLLRELALFDCPGSTDEAVTIFLSARPPKEIPATARATAAPTKEPR